MGKRTGTGYGLHSLETALNNDKVPLHPRFADLVDMSPRIQAGLCI